MDDKHVVQIVNDDPIVCDKCEPVCGFVHAWLTDGSTISIRLHDKLKAGALVVIRQLPDDVGGTKAYEVVDD